MPEILDICVNEKVRESSIRESSTFIIRLNTGETNGVSYQDLTADDNGIYNMSCTTDSVILHRDDQNKVICYEIAKKDSGHDESDIAKFIEILVVMSPIQNSGGRLLKSNTEINFYEMPLFITMFPMEQQYL